MESHNIGKSVKRSRMSIMTFDIMQDQILGAMSVEDIFRLATENHIPYLDVMDLAEKEIKYYCQMMERYPVKIKCYIGSGSMLQDPLNVQSMIHKHLATAKKLNADILMLVPVNAVKDGRKAKKTGHDKVLEKMIEGYQMAVWMAKSTGIKIGLETTPQDFSCCCGMEDCKKILEAVPGLGLIYDTANMMPHGDETLVYYETLKQYIIHVHLKDITVGEKKWSDKILGGEYLPDGRHMNGVLPGMGIVPVREICQKLENDGYSGIYAIEYRRPKGLRTKLEKHSSHLGITLEYLGEKCI